LAARGGPQLRKTWCEIESLAAFYQRATGHYAAALERLDAILIQATEAAYPDRDPVVLTTRYFRADTLFYLGRHAEALAEIAAFAPIEAAGLGADHPKVLQTETLRQEILTAMSSGGSATYGQPIPVAFGLFEHIGLHSGQHRDPQS
jgi:hypothetical protein